MYKKLLFHIIIACLTILLLTGFSSPDEKANKLFVEAFQLIKPAQELEKVSYAEALKLYEDALAKLDRIISKYPSSQLAVKLIQDEAKIESYTITELKEIVSQVKMKADAEASPLACALFVAAHWDLTVVADIAGKYAEAGQYDQALQIVKTIEEPIGKDVALAKIAVAYAKAEQYDQALQIAKTIEDADVEARALVEMAGKYAKAEQYDRALQVAKAILQVLKTIGNDSTRAK